MTNQTIFIAGFLDYGNFAAIAEDGIDLDDWSYGFEASPRVGHVMASFDDQKLECLKNMAISELQEGLDVLHDKEFLDEIDAAVWHTGGWVETKPFSDGALPKMVGRQVWTLASPEWDINDPDKKDGVEPILRLVVEQHRVF